MKAKKVYEFIQKKSLKNSIKDDIGIKVKYKREIEEWFEKWLPNTKYEIKDDFTIIVDANFRLYAKYDLTYIPNNMIINGWAEIIGTQINELPPNLYIKGNLYLDPIEKIKIPSTVKIDGEIEYHTF